jgi:hypothetical protein
MYAAGRQRQHTSYYQPIVRNATAPSTPVSQPPAAETVKTGADPQDTRANDQKEVLLSIGRPASASVRGNLAPASVVTDPSVKDWLKDRWQVGFFLSSACTCSLTTHPSLPALMAECGFSNLSCKSRPRRRTSDTAYEFQTSQLERSLVSRNKPTRNYPSYRIPNTYLEH